MQIRDSDLIRAFYFPLCLFYFPGTKKVPKNRDLLISFKKCLTYFFFLAAFFLAAFFFGAAFFLAAFFLVAILLEFNV